jgi:hypothetical protein
VGKLALQPAQLICLPLLQNLLTNVLELAGGMEHQRPRVRNLRRRACLKLLIPTPACL